MDRITFLKLFFLGTSCLVGCSDTASPTDPQTAASPLPKVATVLPVRKTLIHKTEQPGQFEAFHTTPLFAKVGGYVERLLVDIGDRVTGPKFDEMGRQTEPGQLLAQLSAPELDQELQQKKAIVVQSAAEVEQATAAVKVSQSMEVSAAAAVEEARAAQQRSDAMLLRWKSEHDRVRELAEKKTVTQKLADEAEQQFKAAEATQTEAAAKLRSTQAKQAESRAVVEKAQADLKATQARLKVAQAERDRVAALHGYLEIRAPYTGVITARNIDQGYLVQAARGANETPLFVLMQADVVRLFVDVPESEAALVEPGRPVTVKVPALGNRVFTGTVARTGWALQTGTRALNCEVDVPNPDGALRPGMYGQVELVVAQRDDALVVPASAILQSEGKPVCLTVTADGVVQKRPVEVGIRTRADVEIMSGITEADQIISANVAAFQDGQKVSLPSPPTR